MKIFAFLILVLVADFAMGEDIQMCFMTKMIEPDYYDLKTEFADADDFYFGVKACGEVTLEVAFPRDWESLNLAIQHTFQLWNRYGAVLEDSGDVLFDCNEMNYYWMNKANGVLTIGQGLQSGTDTFITYSSNPFPDGFNWGSVRIHTNLHDSSIPERMNSGDTGCEGGNCIYYNARVDLLKRTGHMLNSASQKLLYHSDRCHYHDELKSIGVLGPPSSFFTLFCLFNKHGSHNESTQLSIPRHLRTEKTTMTLNKKLNCICGKQNLK
ncbi:hypothetical protein CAPTEDRAFT_210929 [Capitella teleta]|uniref:Uncharacterized protein n=1 Tax=Capitella teleta TaxID=283909 RepID=R7V7D1_CAPTE|nr:hypothetical protein CAPTEDRAFT_210929 [Capitella teleta]|eukprot:ELU14474.1 hypothetical protein CAPTEDRAFT_210929 [Capitella teleta]